MSISIKFIISLVLFFTIFLLFPQADIFFSELFFESGEFFLKHNILIKIIYESVPIAVAGFLLFFILSMTSIAFKQYKKEAIYLFFVLALGSGLLVNSILKENWGRARPYQIVEFGGSKQFTRAFVISDQCEKNCSFVSGHASVGFFLMAFYFVTKRRRWIYIGMVYGGIVGLGRIAQGGHFLSDVVLSGYCMYFMAWIIYRFIFQYRRK